MGGGVMTSMQQIVNLNCSGQEQKSVPGRIRTSGFSERVNHNEMI